MILRIFIAKEKFVVYITILTYETAWNQLIYNIDFAVTDIFQKKIKSYVKQENYREVKF